MKRPSRMDAAHRRLRIARYVIGAIAAGAFAGAAVVARAAHPGTHGHHVTTKATIPAESSTFQAASAQSSTSSSSSGGSISPAPAASQPVVQSSGS